MPLLELGVGVFKTSPTGSETTVLSDFLAANLNVHNATIVGKGPGVTEVYGKIKLNGWYPNLRHFAMYPDTDTNWSMIEINNPGTFLFEDIWVHPWAGTTGLAIRTTDWGIVSPGPTWPPRNAPIGGARISVSMLRDFYAYGAGAGLNITNELSNAPPVGQFTNHVRIDGGHIFTDDIGMLISGDPWSMTQIGVRNFHMDVRADGKGLRFGNDTHITWYAPGHIEPSGTLKAAGGQFINGPMENFTPINWPVQIAV